MKIYIAKSNTDTPFLENEHSTLLLPDSFSEYSYIAVPSSGYGYTCYSVRPSEGKVIAARLPKFNSVNDCQLQVFILCTSIIHEIAPPDRVCEKYSITPEKLTEAMEKATNRVMLSDYERELVTDLYIRGIPKRTLITKHNQSSFNINSMLSSQIRHFCRSEYEKRFLTDRIENDFNSGESFFVGISTASHILGVPESFAEAAICDVLDYQHSVKRDKLAFVKNIIFGERDFSALTEDEKNMFSSLTSDIVSFFREKEKAIYDRLSDAIILRGSFIREDLEKICAAMDLDIHTLLFSLFQKGYKPSHPIRRRSLRDLLPD